MHVGASTEKVDNLWSRMVFNEGDSNLYTNFEFCDEINHRHFKNILIYKAKQMLMTKWFREKSTYFRSGVQVNDIEHVTV